MVPWWLAVSYRRCREAYCLLLRTPKRVGVFRIQSYLNFRNMQERQVFRKVSTKCPSKETRTSVPANGKHLKSVTTCSSPCAQLMTASPRCLQCKHVTRFRTLGVKRRRVVRITPVRPLPARQKVIRDGLDDKDKNRRCALPVVKSHSCNSQQVTLQAELPTAFEIDKRHSTHLFKLYSIWPWQDSISRARQRRLVSLQAPRSYKDINRVLKFSSLHFLQSENLCWWRHQRSQTPLCRCCLWV